MRVDVAAELTGLRSLARSLVHGDAEVDDLLQDTALTMLEHPPELDRPVRPWLVTVMLNRWRMDRRGAARRKARELAAQPPEPEQIDPLERAQALRRLGDAVASLPDPYRSIVIARYFDGKTSIELAQELGIPAVTVRTRLLRALEKLRKALDETAPRKTWMRALVPAPGAWLIGGSKATTLFVAFMFLMFLGGGWYVWPRAHSAATSTAPASASGEQAVRVRVAAMPQLGAEPTPGQSQARSEAVDVASGAASGRIIDWSTGDGVVGAELTFTTASGAITLKSGDDGAFELVPPHAGHYTLTQVGAAGYLPYQPELNHSDVDFVLAQGRAVRGLSVFLFPALDYRGRVVDVTGAPVAGAKVTMSGTGETSIDRVEASWTTDLDGRFPFHAADGAVFEAVAGERRGWAGLDEKVMISKQLVITVAKVAPRDATITGKVVDDDGKPVADVLVGGIPQKSPLANEKDAYARAKAFAVTDATGTFELRGLDRDKYWIEAEQVGHAPTIVKDIAGGTKGLTVPLSLGVELAGTVASADGKPIPAFTLLAFKRSGAARDLYAARSVVDSEGKFHLRLPAGNYELLASSGGWAPSAPTAASAPSDGVKLVLASGAIVRGTVVSAADGTPIAHARVTREAVGGGASAFPANAGTVTRSDGTFELRGVPPGPVSLVIGADSYDPRIEAGLTASESGELGPLSLRLSPLAPGAMPKTDYVGIGVELAPDGDDLVVQKVYSGGGAQAAGIVAGDHITAIDGVSSAELGIAGAVAKIRGLPNTTLSMGLRRSGGAVTIVVTRARLQV